MLIKSCLSMIKLITLVINHNIQQQRYVKYVPSSASELPLNSVYAIAT